MKPRIVFVYSTRDYNWLRLARKLKPEPAFWETVQRCDREIRRHLGWSIEDDLIPQEQFQISEEHCEPGLTAMQIGLTMFWKSHGILPSAIVGTCVGEFAAAYSSGELSLENAMELACRIGESFRRGVGPGRMLLVESDRENLEPSSLYNIAACSAGKTMISCSEQDFTAVRELLGQSGLGYRQILSKFALHSPDAANSWQSEFCRPLQTPEIHERKVPLYSALTGGLLDNSPLDIDHWWNVARSPVLNIDEVFSQLFQEGYQVFLEINTGHIQAKTIQEIAIRRGMNIHMLPPGSPNQFPTEFVEQTLFLLDSLGMLNKKSNSN